MLHMSPSSGQAAPGGRELRRNPRYHVDVRLKLVVTKDGKSIMIHGRGNDISETGMALFVAHVLEVGQRLEVEFTLPYSRQPLRVGITVRNKNGYRYGVEFMSLSVPQREEILRLCKALTLLQ
ncbi:MAG TPA: PilZ domain-containing protein [Terriglobales bacterium]|nr:PilZ domain-containing protein [Terriglobales bacterium]